VGIGCMYYKAPSTCVCTPYELDASWPWLYGWPLYAYKQIPEYVASYLIIPITHVISNQHNIIWNLNWHITSLYAITNNI